MSAQNSDSTVCCNLEERPLIWALDAVLWGAQSCVRVLPGVRGTHGAQPPEAPYWARGSVSTLD